MDLTQRLLLEDRALSDANYRNSQLCCAEFASRGRIASGDRRIEAGCEYVQTRAGLRALRTPRDGRLFFQVRVIRDQAVMREMGFGLVRRAGLQSSRVWRMGWRRVYGGPAATPETG